LSPATAFELDTTEVGNVTRNVVVALSDAFIRLSARSVLPVSATLGAAGPLLSKLYAWAVDESERLPAASTAFAVIAWPVYSTCPATGVNVTVEPDTCVKKFEVMSVKPAKSFAFDAPAPIVTTITPVVEFAVTVGAAGAELSKVYVVAADKTERLPAASTAFAVTPNEVPSNFDVDVGVNVTIEPDF
jgi:hypothetical protein